MLKIEYEIKLNDSGRPCIELSPEHEEKPEDKFLCLELTRYLLQGIYARRSSEFDKNTSEQLDNCINLLGQVSDEVAKLLYENMLAYGETSKVFQKSYDAQVNTIEDRNKLNYHGFIYGDKIFRREVGLKVLVTEDMKIYELIGGIDNENWKLVE